MKLYTIEKAEVKTIYTIKLTIDYVPAIIEELRHNGLQDIYWKTNKLSLKESESMTPAELAKAFFSMWRVNNTREDIETIDYIVREALGFDGVENYGYNDACSVSMVVYKYGDKIN